VLRVKPFIRLQRLGACLRFRNPPLDNRAFHAFLPFPPPSERPHRTRIPNRRLSIRYHSPLILRLALPRKPSDRKYLTTTPVQPHQSGSIRNSRLTGISRDRNIHRIPAKALNPTPRFENPRGSEANDAASAHGVCLVDNRSTIFDLTARKFGRKVLLRVLKEARFRGVSSSLGERGV